VQEKKSGAIEGGSTSKITLGASSSTVEEKENNHRGESKGSITHQSHKGDGGNLWVQGEKSKFWGRRKMGF